MANERTASLHIEYDADLTRVREKLKALAEEWAKGIDIPVRPVPAEGVATFGGHRGTPHLVAPSELPASKKAEPGITDAAVNTAMVQRAVGGWPAANVANGMNLAGAGGVRVVGQNSVFAGDMTSWLAQAARSQTESVIRATAPAIAKVLASTTGAGEPGALPRGAVNRVRDEIDRLSVLAETRTPRETLRLRRLEYEYAARRANRPNATDADRDRFVTTGREYDQESRTYAEWERQRRINREEDIEDREATRRGIEAERRMRGSSGAVPGGRGLSAPMSARISRRYFPTFSSGNIGALVRGAILPAALAQLAGNEVNYGVALANAQDGFDVAGADIARGQGMLFGAARLVADPLDYLTGTSVRIAQQRRSAQMGEQVAAQLLAGQQQRTLGGIGIQQSSLAGAGLSYSAGLAGIEAQRRGAEFAAQQLFLPQIQALESEASAIYSKIPRRYRTVLSNSNGYQTSRQVDIGPDLNSDQGRIYSELQTRAQGLRNALDETVKQAGAARVSATRTLGLQFTESQIGVAAQRRVAGLSGAGLDYQARLAEFEAQRETNRRATARAFGAFSPLDLFASANEGQTIDAQRAAFVRTSQRQFEAQAIGIEGQNAAVRFTRQGFGLTGQLAGIAAERTATLLAQPGGQQYLQNRNDPSIDAAQRRILDALDVMFGERAKAAALEYQRALIVSAGNIQAAQMRMSGNPLGAQFASIDAQFRARTAGMSPFSPDYLQALAERGIAQQEARFNYNFNRTQTDIGLRAESQAIGRQLARDPFGAAAFTTAGAGAQRVRELQRQYSQDIGATGLAALGGAFAGIGATAGRFSPEAELARQNTLGQLRAQRQEYLLGFRATELDAWNIMPFNPRDSQNPSDVLGAFRSAREQVEGAGLGADGGQIGIDDTSINKLAQQVAEEIRTSLQSLIDNGS